MSKKNPDHDVSSIITENMQDEKQKKSALERGKFPDDKSQIKNYYALLLSSAEQQSKHPRSVPGVSDIVMSSKLNKNNNNKFDHGYYTPRAAMHRPVPLNSVNKNASSGEEDLSLENLTRKSLPYCLPWSLTGGVQEVQPDFSWLQNSCGGKAAIGVFGGGVMGLLMGVFLGAMSDSTPPIQVIGGKEVPQAPLREQVKVTFRATAEKSRYWCRNFAFITGIFGGSECLVEKYRGKHDRWNAVLSGCIAGAALQGKSGPHAAAVGCGGFAAFSYVIDSFMGTH